MKKKIRDKWVAALRSGMYPQITGNLRQNPGHSLDLPAGWCCLGVLCEIAAAEDIVTGQWNPRSGIWAYGAETDTGVLPAEVMAWAGLLQSDPQLPSAPDDDRTLSLTTLNDSIRLSFTQIADLIETYL